MSFNIPAFSDIGKAAKDILSKDYPVGSSKLELNTSTDNGLKVTVTGDKDNKSGAVFADLKFKYADKPRGFTFTQIIKTSNALSAQIELQDTISKGLKLDVDAALNEKGAQNVKIGAEYKHCFLFLRSSLDVTKPTVNADITTGKDGFLLGAEVSYDVKSSKLVKWSYAGGYVASDYALTLRGLNKCSAWEASFYRQMSSDAEASIKAGGSLKSVSDVTVELGAKYNLDKNAFVKVKTDNLGRLGLGYTQTLRPGVKIGLGGLFDTTRLQENVHKIGLSLVLEF